ncbi:MAG: glycosyltransferase [Chloroflexi bacterium]|nr:glycosyltransferase [Chloroflexota bacterium]MBU1746773.1 glycosyltransferase [Chloroflexota bacterium]
MDDDPAKVKLDNMFISVVIPAYNEQAYLGNCLRSLQPVEHGGQQHYPANGYEIIVADNCSTDSTADIARQFGARVVSIADKGVTHARQGGAGAATGDLLASTDADSIVTPHWLSIIARHFQADAGLVGLMGPVYFREGPLYARAYQAVALNLWFRLFMALGRPCFPGQNFAVRRADFQAIGGYDMRMRTAEDMNLSLRLRHRGRIAWASDLQVHTSARRVTAGTWANLRQGFSDYLLVAILERGTGSPHQDIR